MIDPTQVRACLWAGLAGFWFVMYMQERSIRKSFQRCMAAYEKYKEATERLVEALQESRTNLIKGLIELQKKIKELEESE